MENVIYGSELAKEIRQQLSEEVKGCRRTPCLCVILVGENPASVSYVRGKEKACAEVGFNSKMVMLPETTSQQELLEVVRQCNEDADIDGILVQLPLPAQINEREILDAIVPSKDVDGLHPQNVGKFYLGQNAFIPCTPLGIIELLKKAKVPFEGARAVVVGRSALVGKPVAQLLTNENCTVTVCHSKTKNLPEICREADILVVAIGKAKFIQKDWIKEGAAVIDVGVNRVDGKLVGDVDFEQVQPIAGMITPVPKGVGPMTITMLLKNTLKAYKEKNHD